VAVMPPGSYKPVDVEYLTLSEPEKFVADEGGSLWVPADRLVLKIINGVSEEGAILDAGKAFSLIHPDYLQELYGSRLSLQSGAKRTAVANTPKAMSVQVNDLYTIDGRVGFPQDDNERFMNQSNSTGIRGPKASKAPAKLEPVAKPGAGKMFLILRTSVGTVNADNKNNVVSFTPAGVRLVVNRKNYFPIGTLEAGRVLFRNEVDDQLFVPGGKAADLVFEVPEADVSPDSKDPTARKVASDVFFEFKRFARVDLSGKKIAPAVAEPTALVEVFRKDGMPANAVGRVTNATLKVGTPKLNTTLYCPLNIGTSKADAKGEKEWGTFVLKGNHFLRLEVNPVRSIKLISTGQDITSDFYVPTNSRLVMLEATPAGKDPWKWADDLSSYQLVDEPGTRYKPNGAMAKLNNNGQDMLLVRYDAEKTLPSVPVSKEMKATDVTLLFVVPKGAQLKTLEYKKELLSLTPLKAD
jgi:hypothetical protein